MPCCIRSGRENCNLFGMQEFHPFLDTELFKFMMDVPAEQKIKNGLTKAFARRSYKGLLPENTRTRVAKTGWNAPAHEWFSKHHKNDLFDLIKSRQFIERGIYNIDSVNQMIVSLNGVIQAPGTAFTLSGSNIVFASALTSSDVIDLYLSASCGCIPKVPYMIGS